MCVYKRYLRENLNQKHPCRAFLHATKQLPSIAHHTMHGSQRCKLRNCALRSVHLRWYAEKHLNVRMPPKQHQGPRPCHTRFCRNVRDGHVLVLPNPTIHMLLPCWTSHLCELLLLCGEAQHAWINRACLLVCICHVLACMHAGIHAQVAAVDGVVNRITRSLAPVLYGLTKGDVVCERLVRLRVPQESGTCSGRCVVGFEPLLNDVPLVGVPIHSAHRISHDAHGHRAQECWRHVVVHCDENKGCLKTKYCNPFSLTLTDVYCFQQSLKNLESVSKTEENLVLGLFKPLILWLVLVRRFH